MNWPWPPPRRGDVVGMIIALVLCTAAALLAIRFPYSYWASSGWGFGTGWRCIYTGRGEPACFKKEPLPTPPN